jgi:hypothetical protein
MSVENLTTRGQIRTRKKHRGRSNKNISRKLKINIEQEGGGKKVLNNNQIVDVLTYLMYMKMAIICLKYFGKEGTFTSSDNYDGLTSDQKASLPREITYTSEFKDTLYTISIKSNKLPKLTGNQQETTNNLVDLQYIDPEYFVRKVIGLRRPKENESDTGTNDFFETITQVAGINVLYNEIVETKGNKTTEEFKEEFQTKLYNKVFSLQEEIHGKKFTFIKQNLKLIALSFLLNYDEIKYNEVNEIKNKFTQIAKKVREGESVPKSLSLTQKNPAELDKVRARDNRAPQFLNVPPLHTYYYIHLDKSGHEQFGFKVKSPDAEEEEYEIEGTKKEIVISFDGITSPDEQPAKKMGLKEGMPIIMYDSKYNELTVDKINEKLIDPTTLFTIGFIIKGEFEPPPDTVYNSTWKEINFDIVKAYDEEINKKIKKKNQIHENEITRIKEIFGLPKYPVYGSQYKRWSDIRNGRFYFKIDIYKNEDLVDYISNYLYILNKVDDVKIDTKKYPKAAPAAEAEARRAEEAKRLERLKNLASEREQALPPPPAKPPTPPPPAKTLASAASAADAPETAPAAPELAATLASAETLASAQQVEEKAKATEPPAATEPAAPGAQPYSKSIEEILKEPFKYADLVASCIIVNETTQDELPIIVDKLNTQFKEYEGKDINKNLTTKIINEKKREIENDKKNLYVIIYEEILKLYHKYAKSYLIEENKWQYNTYNNPVNKIFDPYLTEQKLVNASNNKVNEQLKELESNEFNNIDKQLNEEKLIIVTYLEPELRKLTIDKPKTKATNHEYLDLDLSGPSTPAPPATGAPYEPPYESKEFEIFTDFEKQINDSKEQMIKGGTVPPYPQPVNILAVLSLLVNLENEKLTKLNKEVSYVTINPTGLQKTSQEGVFYLYRSSKNMFYIFNKVKNIIPNEVNFEIVNNFLFNRKTKEKEKEEEEKEKEKKEIIASLLYLIAKNISKNENVFSKLYTSIQKLIPQQTENEINNQRIYNVVKVILDEYPNKNKKEPLKEATMSSLADVDSQLKTIINEHSIEYRTWKKSQSEIDQFLAPHKLEIYLSANTLDGLEKYEDSVKDVEDDKTKLENGGYDYKLLNILAKYLEFKKKPESSPSIYPYLGPKGDYPITQFIENLRRAKSPGELTLETMLDMLQVVIKYNLLAEVTTFIEKYKDKLEQTIGYDSYCKDVRNHNTTQEYKKIDVQFVRCLKGVNMLISTRKEPLVTKFTSEIFNKIYNEYLEWFSNSASHQDMLSLESVDDIKANLLEVALHSFKPTSEGEKQQRKERKRKKTEVSNLIAQDELLVNCSLIVNGLATNFTKDVTKLLDENTCSQVVALFGNLQTTSYFGLNFLEIMSNLRDDTSNLFDVSNNIFGRMLGLDETSFNKLLLDMGNNDTTSLDKLSEFIDSGFQQSGGGKRWNWVNSIASDVKTSVTEDFFQYRAPSEVKDYSNWKDIISNYDGKTPITAFAGFLFRGSTVPIVASVLLGKCLTRNVVNATYRALEITYNLLDSWQTSARKITGTQEYTERLKQLKLNMKGSTYLEEDLNLLFNTDTFKQLDGDSSGVRRFIKTELDRIQEGEKKGRERLDLEDFVNTIMRYFRLKMIYINYFKLITAIKDAIGNAHERGKVIQWETLKGEGYFYYAKTKRERAKLKELITGLEKRDLNKTYPAIVFTSEVNDIFDTLFNEFFSDTSLNDTHRDEIKTKIHQTVAVDYFKTEEKLISTLSGEEPQLLPYLELIKEYFEKSMETSKRIAQFKQTLGIFLKYLVNKFTTKDKKLFFMSTLNDKAKGEIGELLKETKKIYVDLPFNYLLKDVNIIPPDSTLLGDKKDLEVRELLNQLSEEEKRDLYILRMKLTNKKMGFEMFIAQLLDLINRICINNNFSEEDIKLSIESKDEITKNINSAKSIKGQKGNKLGENLEDYSNLVTGIGNSNYFKELAETFQSEFKNMEVLFKPVSEEVKNAFDITTPQSKLLKTIFDKMNIMDFFFTPTELDKKNEYNEEKYLLTKLLSVDRTKEELTDEKVHNLLSLDNVKYVISLHLAQNLETISNNAELFLASMAQYSDKSFSYTFDNFNIRNLLQIEITAESRSQKEKRAELEAKLRLSSLQAQFSALKEKIENTASEAQNSPELPQVQSLKQQIQGKATEAEGITKSEEESILNGAIESLTQIFGQIEKMLSNLYKITHLSQKLNEHNQLLERFNKQALDNKLTVAELVAYKGKIAEVNEKLTNVSDETIEDISTDELDESKAAAGAALTNAIELKAEEEEKAREAQKAAAEAARVAEEKRKAEEEQKAREAAAAAEAARVAEEKRLAEEEQKAREAAEAVRKAREEKRLVEEQQMLEMKDNLVEKINTYKHQLSGELEKYKTKVDEKLKDPKPSLNSDKDLVGIFRMLFNKNRESIYDLALENGVEQGIIDEYLEEGPYAELPAAIDSSQTLILIFTKLDGLTTVRPILLNNVETRLVINSYIGKVKVKVKDKDKVEIKDMFLHTQTVPEEITEKLGINSEGMKYYYLKNGDKIKSLILDTVLEQKEHETNQGYKLRNMFIEQNEDNTSKITIESNTSEYYIKDGKYDLNTENYIKNLKQPIIYPEGKNKCRETNGNMGITYDYVERFTYLAGLTLTKAEDFKGIDNMINILDNINTSVTGNNDVILFVFGITGSGKDTFLNSVYGKLLNNPDIHDKDKEAAAKLKLEDKYNIDNILNEVDTPKLNEQWFYTDLKDSYKLKKSEYKSENKAKNSRKTIIDEISSNMRQYTPFNTQSTRGFNIKTFTFSKIQNKSGNITVINVPGFEPLASILILSLYTEKNFTSLYNSKHKAPIQIKEERIAKIDKTTIVGILYKFIFKKLINGNKNVEETELKTLFDDEQILESEKPNTDKKTMTSLTTEINNLLTVLYQSLYILNTLNIMAAILVNFKKIQQLIKVGDGSKYSFGEGKEKKENIAEDELPSIIFDYVKSKFMSEYDISELNLDEEFDFIADKRLNCLKPFYKEGDEAKYLLINNNIKRTSENNIKRTSENNIKISTYYEANSDSFIIGLINKLFITDKDDLDKPKVRYNVNVIRPLRQDIVGDKLTHMKNLPKGATLVRAALHKNKSLYLQPYGVGEAKEKIIKNIVLDATLIETLSGFCEIRDADTKKRSE